MQRGLVGHDEHRVRISQQVAVVLAWGKRLVRRDVLKRHVQERMSRQEAVGDEFDAHQDQRDQAHDGKVPDVDVSHSRREQQDERQEGRVHLHVVGPRPQHAREHRPGRAAAPRQQGAEHRSSQQRPLQRIRVENGRELDIHREHSEHGRGSKAHGIVEEQASETPCHHHARDARQHGQEIKLGNARARDAEHRGKRQGQAEPGIVVVGGHPDAVVEHAQGVVGERKVVVAG